MVLGITEWHDPAYYGHHYHPITQRLCATPIGISSGQATTEVGRLWSPTVSGSEGNDSMTVCLATHVAISCSAQQAHAMTHIHI